MESQIIRYVEENRERLFQIAGDLVRLNSENMPPAGREGECQRYGAALLRGCGWEPELYELSEVAGLREHALFAGNREYAGRPNLAARRRGTGGGRSLVLSGHVDTVPRGTQPWTRDAFGGAMEGGRVYGRGSVDMKAGVALNLFMAEAVVGLGMRLAGDLTVEAVIDEEFGGVNGTLAGRLRGYRADAAIVTEPTSLRVCAGQRGGRTVHISFSARGGILNDNGGRGGVVEQLTHFLVRLRDFAERRNRGVRVHPLYAGCSDPVPVSVTRIFTAPWGTGEPITIPEECKVELYWQLMPGEGQAEVEAEFFEWFDSMITAAPELFGRWPVVEFPIRWMPGSAVDVGEPVVTELAACAAVALGAPAVIAGIEGPCDLFVFHEFGIPAVLWGPAGGNVHAADEYVELDSLASAAKVLLLFVARWCGGSMEGPD
ncbi:MAG: M20/M25/M40 family metallo-hydrolase [Acidobacteriota bacterium]